MPEKLIQNILATICYYDVLDYPLTVFEIWKYLIAKDSESLEKTNSSLFDVLNCLDDNRLRKKVETFRGYYFLSGRKKIVFSRIEHNKISEQKYKLVKKVVYFLRIVPFVHAIALAGRMAMKNAEKKSDLDLLIVLKKEHIFIGRFIVTLVVHVLGMRRHGNRVANRICLNHFLTDEFNVSVRDIFSAREYAFMLPIFNSNNMEIFYQKNEWIETYIINYMAEKSNLKVVEDNLVLMRTRAFLEKCLSFSLFEKFLKKIQTEKISQNFLTNKVGAVIICQEDELAFWPNFEQQGPRVFEAFQKKIKENLIY